MEGGKGGEWGTSVVLSTIKRKKQMAYNLDFSLVCLQDGYNFAQLCLALLDWAPGCGLGSSLFYLGTQGGGAAII